MATTVILCCLRNGGNTTAVFREGWHIGKLVPAMVRHVQIKGFMRKMKEVDVEGYRNV